VGFDVSRAAAEAFQSRLPFVDRLLSYLYFADAAVLEQSTWDESGRGVTIVGRKGPAAPGGLLMAAALPRATTLAGLEPGHPDAVRGLALLSMAWALASLEEDRLREPVTLVAARPDPAGLTLRSVLESGTVTARAALAATPAGPRPRRAAAGVIGVELSLDLPVRPLKAPLRDVVTWVLRDPGMAALDALARLDATFADGEVVPLALGPGRGVHLGPAEGLAMTVGLRGDVQAPDGWSLSGRPTRVGGGGSCRQRLEALLGAARATADAAREAWTAAGLAAPREPVRLVDVGSGAASTALLTVAVPPGDPVDLASRLEAEGAGPGGVAARVVLAAGSPGRPLPGDSPDLPPGTAACLVDLVPEVLSLGPGAGDTSDPEAAAREWGLRYRDALRDLLIPGGSR
jgi:hypothetical protein